MLCLAVGTRAVTTRVFHALPLISSLICPVTQGIPWNYGPGDFACPFPLLTPYFQAHELPLFSTTTYKVSELPCAFAFWSSPLPCPPAPGRCAINITYQCRFLPCLCHLSLSLAGNTSSGSSFSRGNSFDPSPCPNLKLNSKNQFKTVVSLPRILRQRWPES